MTRLLWVAYHLQCSCINSLASSDLLVSICWCSAHCCPLPGTMWSSHSCSFAPPCGRGTQCQAVKTSMCNKSFSWVTSSEHNGRNCLQNALQPSLTYKDPSLKSKCCPSWEHVLSADGSSLINLKRGTLVRHCTRKEDHLLHKAFLNIKLAL